MSVTRRFLLGSVALVVIVGAGAWALVTFGIGGHGLPLPGLSRQASAPAEPTRKIKATLFYLGDDGWRLKGVEREVEYGEGRVEQAKRIIEAQVAPAPAPLVSAIPPGTKLRALFVTDRGEAFVDLSREVSTAHPGGSLNEIFTVYTIVYAITTNLPAISAVQILVDGREVDTLAGHVDLRRPLPRTQTWLDAPGGAPAPPAAAPVTPVPAR